LREEITALLTSGDANARQAVISEHVLAMSGTLLPSLHCCSRRVFVASIERDVFRRGAERNLLANFIQTLIESPVIDSAAPRHLHAMRSRLRANDWVELEGLKSVLMPELVYLLMKRLNEFWKSFVDV